MFHSEVHHNTGVKQVLFWFKIIIFLPGKSILIHLIQQVTKWATSLLFSPVANAECHQKALESSFRPESFNAGKVDAGQNRSLWSVSRDKGQFSISDELKERKAREWERERAGLPCVKLPVIMCSSDPDVDRIPDAFSNAWSSAHQNRLEDNERKCLS